VKKVMDHSRIKRFSAHYGPPKVDLRKARIRDCWGGEKGAQVHLSHKKPEDVTREHLKEYHDVFSFVEKEDLLFYLCPIIRNLIEGGSDIWLDNYLYNLDESFESLDESLDKEEKQILRSALETIYQNGGHECWGECPNLQEATGLKAPH